MDQSSPQPSPAPEQTPPPAPAQDPPTQPVQTPQAQPDPAAAPGSTQPIPQHQHGLFRGRVGRVGYLLGIVYPVVGFVVLLLVVFLLSLVTSSHGSGPNTAVSVGVFIVALVWVVVMIPLSYSIQIRRWHDMGHSGWFCLINFIPIAGLVVLILQLFNPGTPGSNQYGDPYTGGADPMKVYGLH